VRCAAAKPRVNAEKPRFFVNTHFHRRFIQKFSGIAGPLITLTKTKKLSTSNFESPDVAAAFQLLKKSFVHGPLLMHFSFDKARIVHVDSSGYAIAAV
jgi:hypothetical protein